MSRSKTRAVTAAVCGCASAVGVFLWAEPLIAEPSARPPETQPAAPAGATAPQPAAQPPARSPWVMDLNAGVPKLQSNDFRIVGDGTLGYATERFGVVAQGAYSTYDSSSDRYSLDSTSARGNAEGWWLLGDRQTALELRATAGTAVYDSTYVPKTGAAGYFHDEDSWMGRGGVLVGGRLCRGDFEGALLAGGGVQYETYDYLKTNPNDPKILTTSTQTSGRLESRLTAIWHTLPDKLSLRLRTDFSYFSITRDALVVARPTAGPVVAATSTTFHQMELNARLFAMGDFAAVWGIIPTLFGGVDWIRMGSGDGSVSTVVPLGGLGLFRSWL